MRGAPKKSLIMNLNSTYIAEDLQRPLSAFNCFTNAFKCRFTCFKLLRLKFKDKLEKLSKTLIPICFGIDFGFLFSLNFRFTFYQHFEIQIVGFRIFINFGSKTWWIFNHFGPLGSGMPQEASRLLQDGIPEPIWTQHGPKLAPSWLKLGPCWPQVGSNLAQVGPMLGPFVDSQPLLGQTLAPPDFSLWPLGALHQPSGFPNPQLGSCKTQHGAFWASQTFKLQP